ncbi:MAG TPA: metal-binding protein, partial [Halococcus sp.]|nr:metal-binding protein [Halococcus sp.]
MDCRRCGSRLERAGDFCLVCRSANADTVVCEVGRERATVTNLHDGERVGTWTVTTVLEEGENRTRERRNFAGRITDEIHRKRPEEVYATGEREVLQILRAQLHYDLRRIVNPGEEPVETVLSRASESPLAVVETPPREKLGGAHSTLVGGRVGRDVIG